MTSILSPLVEMEAVKLSKDGKVLYRKQILPRGKFDYKGETIDFDRIGQDVKKAFDSGAMDQVPFQLADAGNNHNFDPKNYRGEVVNVELTDEGVFGTFDFSKFSDMQDMVEKNPKFGVSAQIDRSDKENPHVFGHILGTLNPRVKGMKPWEKVSLSAESDLTDAVDLVGVELSNAKEDGDVTKPVETPETVTLSKGDYDRVMKIVEAQEKFEKDLNLSKETETEEVNPAIKLANEQAESALKLARESQVELAKARWDRNHDALVAAGVPPVMLSKAALLMSAPASDIKTIELSNGDKTETVSPQAVVLSLLEEMKGLVNLSKDEGHEFNGEGEEDPGYEAFRDDFFANQF